MFLSLVFSTSEEGRQRKSTWSTSFVDTGDKVPLVTDMLPEAVENNVREVKPSKEVNGQR